MRLLSIGLLLVAVCGCTTPYRPASRFTRVGYSDVQLDEHVYRVSFVGNDQTPAAQTRDYAMLRAAEITLSAGYQYFAVLKDVSDENLCAAATEDSVYTVRQPITHLTVQCFKQKPEEGLSFNAEVLYDSVRAQYGIASS